VAGGANRQSAHEMTEKMNLMITHTWVRAHWQPSLFESLIRDDLTHRAKEPGAYRYRG
jgi:hypothetical protein